MSTQVRAGIVGGAGYTGGETLRLLLRHPHIDISFVQSRSQAGLPVSSAHADLLGETNLTFSSATAPADVIFLCLGHGESKKYLSENPVTGDTRIIDLSQDFRIDGAGNNFVYGLPEVNREAIRRAHHVANPGCFATAIQLGLLPLAKAGRLGDAHITGITGSTGAGQKLQDTTHFTWRAGNISAYKTLNHQHLQEIRQTLEKQQPGFRSALNFVPWRGDFTRGIFVTSVTETDHSQADALELFRSTYQDHPFTVVSNETISLKQVVNTNKCLIHIEQQGHMLAIHSAIDNLLKGASGQAIQNMNLMFGLPEDAGLRLKATAF